jgi:DnaJ-class molecular chaperone
MSSKRDYYEVLGLSKSAAAAEIKAAYRKMALKFHPDRNKEAGAEDKFKEINEAYQVLSDPKKKQTYDQFGHAAFDPSSGMGGGQGPFGGGFGGFQNAGGGGPFTWSYRTGGDANQEFDMGDPFEIFEQFFGGGFAGGGARRRRPHYSLKIDFMEAVNGVTKEVEIEGKRQKIKVPAGANDGTRIRFSDFDVSIDVASHKRFKRDGYDVFVDQNISFSTAALGGEIQVETLDGKLKLKVRAGTLSHSLIRLRGEGVKHLQSAGRGDLYVRLIVEVPEKLNGAQKKALEKLREVL